MNKNKDGIPPALKHGCYSGLTLLPTENRADFDRLHRDLVAEFAPRGRLEEIAIENLARRVWRRENMATYLLAEAARDKRASIYKKLHGPTQWGVPLLGLPEQKETRSPEELETLRREAEERARRELGSALELSELGNVATEDYLLKELELIERLDAMIVKCLKEFLLIRGVKSISSSATGDTTPRIGKVA